MFPIGQIDAKEKMHTSVKIACMPECSQLSTTPVGALILSTDLPEHTCGAQTCIQTKPPYVERYIHLKLKIPYPGMVCMSLMLVLWNLRQKNLYVSRSGRAL